MMHNIIPQTNACETQRHPLLGRQNDQTYNSPESDRYLSVRVHVSVYGGLLCRTRYASIWARAGVGRAQLG